MPKNAIITNPGENIDALQLQMQALNQHLNQKMKPSELRRDLIKNQSELKFLRFSSSFLASTKEINGTLHLHSNNNLTDTIAPNVGIHTKQYLDTPLSKFPFYLFQLISQLDALEKKSTELPTEKEITVQKFIKLIDDLDERLTAHQPMQDEGCIFLKSTDSEVIYNLRHLDTVAALKRLSESITTNAAYIRINVGSDDSEFYYINKKQKFYGRVSNSLTQTNKEAIDQITESILLDTPTKLSSEHLAGIHANTGHHHMDEIDQIKENFAEFQRTFLPYLEARKLLIDAKPGSADTFLPSDYDKDKDTFGNSVKAVSEKLNALKNDPEGLKNAGSALDQAEAARVALEEQKQEAVEKAKQEALEKQKQEAAEQKASSKKSPEEIKIENLNALKKTLEAELGLGVNEIGIVEKTAHHINVTPPCIIIQASADKWKSSLEYQAKLYALTAVENAALKVERHWSVSGLPFHVLTFSDVPLSESFTNDLKTEYAKSLRYQKAKLNIAYLDSAFVSLYPQANQRAFVRSNNDETREAKFQMVGFRAEELSAVNAAIQKTGLNFKRDAYDPSHFVSSDLEEIKMMDKPVLDAFTKSYQENLKSVSDVKDALLFHRTWGEEWVDWFQDNPKATFALSILGLLFLLAPGIAIMRAYFAGTNSTKPIDNFIVALGDGKDATHMAIDQLTTPEIKQAAADAAVKIFPDFWPTKKSEVQDRTTAQQQPETFKGVVSQAPRDNQQPQVQAPKADSERPGL